ncbi:MAG: Loki-CTERM sorting domain-containing protein, partial [Promethearchaeota archaeon]
SFNQPIGPWDVSNVIYMEFMFYYTTSFDQNIGGWDVSSVTSMDHMFEGVTLSTTNYDALLIGWSQLELQTHVTFHGGYSKYSKAAESARQSLIEDFTWGIVDGGRSDPVVIPGYDLWILLGVCGLITAIILRKQKITGK